jgi:hypothetical protein
MAVVQKNVHVDAPPAFQSGIVREVAADAVPTERLRGRLNLFQRAMLEWRDMHPYNAVHAVRVEAALDAGAMTSAIEDTLTRAGLTGLVVDCARGRYEWRGGRARCTLAIVRDDGAASAVLARTFEHHLNERFPREGPLEPFRFFVIEDGAGFYLGVSYDHFIAGGDSIVALLNMIVDSYSGVSVANRLTLYPPTHRRLFLRDPLYVLRAIARFPAIAASCRRTIRPRYRNLEDGHNGFTFFTLDAAHFDALRRTSKQLGVTLNDLLIALLLLAQDAQAPGRDRSKRRREFAVASIMNLRDAHGEDVHQTFGQFLSSFRVSHVVPPGITLSELARDVHRATARIKREKLYLTTLSAIAVDRVIARFQDRGQRMGVYAKSYPVGAGVSTLNVKALWRPSFGTNVPTYVRGVPTGPASPLVVAVTTTADRLFAGISYRTSAYTPDNVNAIRDDMIQRIQKLQ